jgi:hypothetical protein
MAGWGLPDSSRMGGSSRAKPRKRLMLVPMALVAYLSGWLAVTFMLSQAQEADRPLPAVQVLRGERGMPGAACCMHQMCGGMPAPVQRPTALTPLTCCVAGCAHCPCRPWSTALPVTTCPRSCTMRSRLDACPCTWAPQTSTNTSPAPQQSSTMTPWAAACRQVLECRRGACSMTHHTLHLVSASCVTCVLLPCATGARRQAGAVGSR